jgi:AraC-like DNA-binding protein
MDWTARINPQIHLCWSGSWRRGVIEPPRLLADNELVVVESGACRLELAGQVLQLQAGDWAVVPAGAWHRSLAVGSGCTRYCIHFDWEWTGLEAPRRWFRFADQTGRIDARPPPDWLPREVLHGSAEAELTALAGRVCVRWRAGDRHGARAIALELLLGLLAPRQAMTPDDHIAVLASQVKERLDQGGPDLGALRTELRGLGHSYEYLCRCFTRTYGMPPLRYLTLVRLELAKRLLLEDAAVGSIARRLGYGDAAYFARLFRRLVGQAPAVWRMRERAGGSAAYQPSAHQ